MSARVVKGTRVLVHRYVVDGSLRFSLAGAMPKVAAVEESFEGVVTHLRGDHPTSPTRIEFTVRRDDGLEATVEQRHVVAVIEEAKP